MTYPFMNASSFLNDKSQKQNMTELFQETLSKEFYNATDWYTIQEETSLASGQYQNVDVRINSVIAPTTGTNIEDDYKKLLFQDITHDVDLGRMYQFDSNYWITTNVDKIKTLAQTVMVKRCNNTLRWIDESTGSVNIVPCSLDYLINENRDYATAGSALVTPSGMVQCIVQYNDKTMNIQPNQRFLFGSPGHWTAFRVEGGGINNFNNAQTTDNSTIGFIRFSLAVDYSGTDTGADDLVNGIANVNVNVYSLVLNESIISGGIGQDVQLVAVLTLNGETVTRTLVWSSSNESIATVDNDGLVTFVAEGTATITCALENNISVKDTCGVSIGASPVDTYQVVFSPTTNYVYEGQTKLWTVYLYKNTIQQADAFTISANPNTIPAGYFVFTQVGDNSFQIQNMERFLTDVVTITADTGVYNGSFSIMLRGAW